MKQSFIITAVICLLLGESCSLINKKESNASHSPAYCSVKVCNPSAGRQKNAAEVKPYIPMETILGYN